MYARVHILTAAQVEAALMNEAYPVGVETAIIPPNTSPRLLDQVRGILRARHDSYRTEQAYAHSIRRFVLFHGKRHPREMGMEASELPQSGNLD